MTTEGLIKKNGVIQSGDREDKSVVTNNQRRIRWDAICTDPEAISDIHTFGSNVGQLR